VRRPLASGGKRQYTVTMSLSGSVDRMRESFEAQFEPAGDNRYLYRRNQKGEPIPVTGEERDRFSRNYLRQIWFILGGMTVALLGFGGLILWWTVWINSELPDVSLYIGLGVITATAIALMYWVRGGPARALEGRTPVGRERTKDEMRAILFKKLSYGQLAAVVAVGAILPFTLRSRPDVFRGWGRLWLVYGAAIILIAAVQAFRKWRFESEHPSDTY